MIEMLRVIKEVEPQKPSTRLSGSGRLPSLAASRQTEPKKLTKLFRGELDWMVMKALEKDRSRRYETANGFAMDIQRYLSDEPVLAGPPSTRYRLKKFVHRNRPQVVAAVLVFLALLGGIAGTTIGLIEARRQRSVAVAETEAKEQARQAEAEQRGIAEAAAIAEREAKLREQARADGEARERKRADVEKERAIRFLDRALDTLRATTGDDVEKLIGSRKELAANEREYLEAIAKRWQDFAKQSETDAEARVFLAEGHFRVASLWHKLGRVEEACTEYRLARDARETLRKQFPTVQEHQHELAKTRLNLGILLAERGFKDEGQVEIQAALDLLTELAKQDPESPKYQSQLAVNRFNLGAIFAVKLDANKAVLEFLAAHDLQTKLVDRYPEEIEYQRQLAHTCSNLANVLAGCEKREEAVLFYREASRLQKTLADRFPKVADYQESLADTHNGLGIVLSELGRHKEALPEYVASRDARKKLAEQFPAIPRFQVDLGGSYCNFGNLLRDQGQPADSVKWLDLAVQTLQEVHRKEPKDSRAKEYLRNSHIGRAQAFDQLKKHEQASKDWELVLELSPAAQRPYFRATRVLSRFQSGLIAEAVAELGELTKSETWSWIEWYNFACLYALASSKIADKKGEYEERAVELLRKSVKAGFKEVAHLKHDPSLNALRERDDFKTLLAELEKKFPPAKRSDPH
jgi:eukaryotic-like serine/threonine-protein kinase